MYKYKLSFTTIIEQFKINGPLNTTEMKSPFESKYCSIANNLFNTNVQYKLILKQNYFRIVFCFQVCIKLTLNM